MQHSTARPGEARGGGTNVSRVDGPVCWQQGQVPPAMFMFMFIGLWCPSQIVVLLRSEYTRRVSLSVNGRAGRPRAAARRTAALRVFAAPHRTLLVIGTRTARRARARRGLSGRGH
eukprot:COSAG02_NODE_5409_length_4352_cov_3.033153_1_plen_116_part_00